MNLERLDKLLKMESDSIVGGDGYWTFNVKEMPMVCIADQKNNRMRMLTPVAEAAAIPPDQLRKCMEANFHSVLDVRYAISEEILWVAFIHPLEELNEDQIKNAIVQLYNASFTFGSLYSSGPLVFPGNDDEEETPLPSRNKKM